MLSVLPESCSTVAAKLVMVSVWVEIFPLSRLTESLRRWVLSNTEFTLSLWIAAFESIVSIALSAMLTESFVLLV